MDPASLVFNIVMVVIALLTLIATIVTMHHAINIEQKLSEKKYEYELLGRINSLYYEFEKEIAVMGEGKQPILSEDEFLKEVFGALYEIKNQAVIYGIKNLYMYVDSITRKDSEFDEVNILKITEKYFKERNKVSAKLTDYKKISKKLGEGDKCILREIRNARDKNLDRLRKGADL